jgi:hypothetical protein
LSNPSPEACSVGDLNFVYTDWTLSVITDGQRARTKRGVVDCLTKNRNHISPQQTDEHTAQHEISLDGYPTILLNKIDRGVPFTGYFLRMPPKPFLPPVFAETAV